MDQMEWTLQRRPIRKEEMACDHTKGERNDRPTLRELKKSPTDRRVVSALHQSPEIVNDDER